MDEGLSPQKRRAHRSNLWMTASVEHGGGSLSLVLRNLSSHGALVEGDHGFCTGDQVLFRKNELEVPGCIAWVDGKKAGIAFAASLDPEIVLRHVPAPPAFQELVHKRPGFRSRMSSEERRYAETLWGRPLPSTKA